jgi:peroxiredoxin
VTDSLAPPDLGHAAPDFTVSDAKGGTFHLADACAAAPLVLVFYRGHW